MTGQSDEPQSQLYLLRIWATAGAGGQLRFQGKLQPVLHDGSYYFAGNSELLALLTSLLSGPATGPTSLAPDPDPHEADAS
jgi:hypothetical protein